MRLLTDLQKANGQKKNIIFQMKRSVPAGHTGFLPAHVDCWLRGASGRWFVEARFSCWSAGVRATRRSTQVALQVKLYLATPSIVKSIRCPARLSVGVSGGEGRCGRRLCAHSQGPVARSCAPGAVQTSYLQCLSWEGGLPLEGHMLCGRLMTPYKNIRSVAPVPLEGHGILSAYHIGYRL